MTRTIKLNDTTWIVKLKVNQAYYYKYKVILPNFLFTLILMLGRSFSPTIALQSIVLV